MFYKIMDEHVRSSHSKVSFWFQGAKCHEGNDILLKLNIFRTLVNTNLEVIPFWICFPCLWIFNIILSLFLIIYGSPVTLLQPLIIYGYQPCYIILKQNSYGRCMSVGQPAIATLGLIIHRKQALTWVRGGCSLAHSFSATSSANLPTNPHPPMQPAD